MSLAPSEQESLEFLSKVIPDLDVLVGPECAKLLAAGRKIELKAVVSATGRAHNLVLPLVK